MKNNNENAPVIIAVGQKTYRDMDLTRSPVDAMEDVARLAFAEVSGDALLKDIDALATIRFIAEANEHVAALMPPNAGETLRELLGLDNANCYRANIGGNTPQMLVNHFADKLVAGEVRTVMLCGGELIASFFKALSAGSDLSFWQNGADKDCTQLVADKAGTSAFEDAHGLFEPINTYPLFESAIRHHMGHSITQHQQHLGALCSRMSAVAASNEHAWKMQKKSSAEIASVSERNRYIGFPYTKAMNAVLAVDMAAAVIMTTAGNARKLGVEPGQMIYLTGTADADDRWHVSERLNFHSSPAIKVAAESALSMAGLGVDDIDLFDLYSCFPCAVEVACDAIGLASDDPRGVTVTGGLPFFGGPGNNYSLHAIAEMVSRLRNGGGKHGLVTANGYYLTKHAVGIYSTAAPQQSWSPTSKQNLQQQLDTLDYPALEMQASGTGTIEAYTVAHSRTGPERAIVIGRLNNQRRFIANTTTDEATLNALLERDAVGLQGTLNNNNGLVSFELN
ncbi:acetyl-CoA acetyltransferase [Oceanicoccus sp. KOV_DT_Chl]|uniref:thiolase C-terminal domain-containing protein n=1 Tax=Oceanicoccus sp. KOV_DT_Chl TaxID=1904639 RepID=UPI000C7A734F|nr:acetyl-CoA acetyltransferase [Oceanicoccus sp. KOV_DT_Chl]